MVLSSALAGVSRVGLGALGIAAVMVAMSGPSAAQVDGKAAAAPPPAAASDAAKLDKGRALFTDFGCASCHSLSDAGATGHVGPALDGDSALSEDFIVGRIANGQGVMPSFSGQLTPDEISAIAAYVMKGATKAAAAAGRGRRPAADSGAAAFRHAAANL